ncbi:MAG: metallophosphoesterase [Hyphomicrobiales bacterium]
MYTLAHLSDIHLGPLPRPPLRSLGSKRIIGYANWLRGRRRIHSRPVLEAITDDLAECNPDHIAVTGDLVNIGLPAEFEAATGWLHSLGNPDDVSAIPGNHDAYVRMAHAEGIGLWSDFMSSDAGYELPGGEYFPYVRLRGPIAIVGLSTAIPTPVFRAWGRLGEAQLKALPAILDRLGEAGRFRAVLIHHPPTPGLTSSRRSLRDSDKLEAILHRHGAELVLFGHNHRSMHLTMPGPAHKIPLIGVPSASATGPTGQEGRYNLYAIGGKPGHWSCEMVTRSWRREGGGVIEIDRRQLY